MYFYKTVLSSALFSLLKICTAFTDVTLLSVVFLRQQFEPPKAYLLLSTILAVDRNFFRKRAFLKRRDFNLLLPLMNCRRLLLIYVVYVNIYRPHRDVFSA